MEKDLFIKVLAHYSESSEEEAMQVLSLKKSFPYSQLLQTLSARVSKDHGFADHARDLQRAAVYAADRAVLKDVMTQDELVKTVSPTAVKTSLKTKVAESVVEVKEEEIQEESASGGLAEEVMIDLEKLHQARHKFEMMFANSGNIGGSTIVDAPPANVFDTPKVEDQNTETADAKEAAKTKKERIVELVKAMEDSKEVAPPVEEVKPRKKREGQPEAIIEEIVSSKEVLEPESVKQKEQLAIIEEFIKTQPTISHSKDKPLPAPAGDLSTIKTGEFSDNIVSETLVEILLKQGKKDKAIEVLKKLIWKFPQKKAYFAAQIEDLKK